MTPDALIETFELFDDWEDRYGYLIELGRKLPPLDPVHKTEANRVRGCVSQVWLIHEVRDGRVYFSADSDAFIVKGLAAILIELLSGRTPEQIAQTDIQAIFEQIGLESHLTPSRRSGFFSMVSRMRGAAQVAA